MVITAAAVAAVANPLRLPFFVFIFPLFPCRVSLLVFLHTLALSPDDNAISIQSHRLCSFQPRSHLSFPLAKEVTGYSVAVDRDSSREIYILYYERARVMISSRCWYDPT